jgi:sugar phosphate isomerase/epimerase
MKISIVSDEISQDLGEVEAFLRRHAVEAIEIRTIGGRRVPDLRPEDLATLAAWAERGSPRITGVSPGIFKGSVLDAALARRQLEETLPRTLDLARRWNAAFVVAFTFETAHVEADDPALPGARERAFRNLRAAAEQCAARGLPLLLENEPGFLAESGADVAALLTAIDHPSAAANWDPCNGNEFTPGALARALDRLGPRIGNVHVKNGVLAAGERFARCGPLAAGAIDWRAHLADLARRGYRGHLGIETHHAPLPEASAALLAELRAILPPPEPGS